MIVYFANRGMTIIDTASTSTKDGLMITNDLVTEELENASRTLEFDLVFDEATRTKAIEATKAGNYILRKHGNDYEFYQIIESEMDSNDEIVNVYAEDVGLDLLNEVTDNSYEKNTTAYNIEQYMTKLLYDSGFVIGINELGTGTTKVLTWQAGQTMTTQILSVANSFRAEVGFSFEINGLKVTKKILNIYSKRGNDTNIKLHLNKQLDNIKVKESISTLATCYRVTGGTPEGASEPITLAGYKYDDGDFYVTSSGWLMSRNALSKWSRYQWEQGVPGDVGHIVKNFKSELTTQEAVFNSALSSLKQVCDTKVTYDVDISLLPDNVRIGDRVYIVDSEHDIYVKARVLKLEISDSDTTKSKATLGDYITQKKDLSSKIQQLSDDFVKLASKRQLFTWTVYADDEYGKGISLHPLDKTWMGVSYNHTTKQDDTSLDDPTIYSYVKIKGDPGSTLYTWVAYADNNKGTNLSFDPKDKAYIGFAYNKDVPASETKESEEPSWYKWSLIKGNPGETNYTWVKYATDDKGSNMSDSSIDRSYIGIAYNKSTKEESLDPKDYTWTKMRGDKGDDGVGVSSWIEQYYLSTSHTSLIGGEWLDEIPEIKSGTYLWTKSIITYTNGEKTTSKAKCVSGFKGEDAISLYIESSNGTSFRNNSIATTMTVVIIYGSNRIENSTAMKQVFGDEAKIIWYEKKIGAEEFVKIDSSDKRISDDGFILTIQPNDVYRKSTFNCELDF